MDVDSVGSSNTVVAAAPIPNRPLRMPQGNISGTTEVWARVMLFMGKDVIDMVMAHAFFRNVAEKTTIWKRLCGLETPQPDPFQFWFTDPQLWQVLYVVRQVEGLEPWKRIDPLSFAAEWESLGLEPVVRENFGDLMRRMPELETLARKNFGDHCRRIVEVLPEEIRKRYTTAFEEVERNEEQMDLRTLITRYHYILRTTITPQEMEKLEEGVRHKAEAIMESPTINLLGGRQLQYHNYSNVSVIHDLKLRRVAKLGSTDVCGMAQLDNGVIGVITRNDPRFFIHVPNVPELKTLKNSLKRRERVALVTIPAQRRRHLVNHVFLVNARDL